MRSEEKVDLCPLRLSQVLSEDKVVVNQFFNGAQTCKSKTVTSSSLSKI